MLIAAALLMSFFALGAWSSLYAYTPELLPTRMRTTGMGAATTWPAWPASSRRSSAAC